MTIDPAQYMDIEYVKRTFPGKARGVVYVCYDNNMMAVLVSERGTTTYRLLANMFGLWPSTITVRGNRIEPDPDSRCPDAGEFELISPADLDALNFHDPDHAIAIDGVPDPFRRPVLPQLKEAAAALCRIIWPGGEAAAPSSPAANKMASETASEAGSKMTSATRSEPACAAVGEGVSEATSRWNSEAVSMTARKDATWATAKAKRSRQQCGRGGPSWHVPTAFNSADTGKTIKVA